MIFQYKPEWYSESFGPVLLSRKRYLIVFGGRGSGKTRHIMLKLFAKTFRKTHTAIYYCRAEFETIRKTTFKDLINFLKSVPELKAYFDYSESPNSSMTFTNRVTGYQIAPFGLSDPEDTKGISEATDIWIDEIDKCTKEQYQFVDAVLRTPQAEYLQFIGSFNPVDEKHWLRAQFFHPDDAYKPHPDYGDDLQIHHSTLYDNEFIDNEAYARSLGLAYKGDENGLNINIKGLWGKEKNDAPWLYNLIQETHFRPTLEFRPTYPVYLSFDFNNDPFTCVAFQQSPQQGLKDSFAHGLKEFSGTIKVEEMCAQIKGTFPASIFYVTGDRNGNNEDVGRNQTLYQLIAGHLGINPRTQLNTNTINLEHADSRLLCNTMLANYPSILFSKEGCPNLTTQMVDARIDPKSNKPSTLLKDRKDNKNDELDCYRYFMQTYFLEYARKFLYAPQAPPPKFHPLAHLPRAR
ncbi:MAG: hypothetical protein EOP52_12475 [Sphingobacteriales bacterium]|nr:MAG: hypothetical protein EOP52_12475 [Sphingobacteriales bacterium]